MATDRQAVQEGVAVPLDVVRWLGVWAAEGVDAKGGPGEDSFCRVCSPIAVAMGQKAGKKWTAAAVLQPTFLLPPTLLAAWAAEGNVGITVEMNRHGGVAEGVERIARLHRLPRLETKRAVFHGLARGPVVVIAAHFDDLLHPQGAQRGRQGRSNVLPHR